ncbi:SDR family NAD(P)-dependent oxidoreductase [Neolewinella aurantiaca]|uniref:SDR family NAD(P)-dependent oxidoreductase n=1 Tax=Neolewinella aurantiaca TaxID=2602767 RepID=A0A5C7FSA3_9BACT|nr:SDR family NAD(P)-dependent oxidoreductase [Neolewinella aurantiaca]TXF89044.1 SDR family NAD(P)-dependent oxidoreductase [Neolewinella aurantiaca]
MIKTIFITGSTDGIGLLAAKKLAAAGFNIILHGRNARKLDAVKVEVSKESAGGSISGYVADLSDLKAVGEMAEAVISDHPKIDALINNAGVLLADSPRDENGLDIRFTVNFLAPVLLTRKLLPALKAADAPRVISLSSAAQSPVSIAALQGSVALADQAAYAQSKLALTIWNSAMAAQYGDIVFIAVNPGSLLNTKMVKEAYGKHWAPADKGADILIDLVTDNKHLSKTGAYFDNDRGSYSRAHPDAYDQDTIDELMQVTDQLLNTFYSCPGRPR